MIEFLCSFVFMLWISISKDLFFYNLKWWAYVLPFSIAIEIIKLIINKG